MVVLSITFVFIYRNGTVFSGKTEFGWAPDLLIVGGRGSNPGPNIEFLSLSNKTSGSEFPPFPVELSGTFLLLFESPRPPHSQHMRPFVV